MKAGGTAPLNLTQHDAVDANCPIECGGVAVYPGHVIVGDDDGAMVVPGILRTGSQPMRPNRSSSRCSSWSEFDRCHAAGNLSAR